jgi:type I restriction enzyme S subunit
MVPDGWREAKLGELFESSREKGRPGLPTMSVTLNDGLVLRDSLERKTDTNLAPTEHLRLREGYIAYNMMRMWQGASGLSRGDALVSPAYVVLKPAQNVDPVFASYFFKAARTVYLFWAYSYGLTKDRLRLYYPDFSIIPVVVPPIDEQRKIGEVLSTWDHAIKTVEKLLENSQRQKKALMQRLLSGELRFSNFSYRWQKYRLRELTEIRYGKSPNGVIDEFGNYPIVGTGGVTGRSNTPLYERPSVVVGRKGTIDKPILVEEPFWAIDTTFYCVPYGTHDLVWLYYLLLHLNLKRYNEASGVPSLSRESLYSIVVEAPEPKEQRLIGSVLKNADSEVAALRNVLDRLVTEKSALMQQLFAGKRRILVGQAREAAHA